MSTQHVRDAEKLPARVKVQCPSCGRPVTTSQAGNTTRCPVDRVGCGAAIPVPAGLTRPPVPLVCYSCSHAWTSRARAGSTVRCPACEKPRRVPTGSRRPSPVPAPKTPAPRASRERLPARPRKRRQAAPRPAPVSVEHPTDPEQDSQRDSLAASVMGIAEALLQPAMVSRRAPIRETKTPRPVAVPPRSRRPKVPTRELELYQPCEVCAELDIRIRGTWPGAVAQLEIWDDDRPEREYVCAGHMRQLLDIAARDGLPARIV